MEDTLPPDIPDSNGRYDFCNLDNGNYSIRLMHLLVILLPLTKEIMTL